MMCRGRLSIVLIWLLGGNVVAKSSETCNNVDSSSISSPLILKFLVGTEQENTCLDTIWETSPRLWHNVEGVNASSLFSFSDAVSGAEGGLLDHASVALSDHAQQGKWVSEYSKSASRDELRSSLRRGTVFFNGAGLVFPKLAQLASLAQGTFGLPVNVNVYVTEPGREVSVSPHTDAQNVLVFQTQGRKRWRVWAPPARRPGKDPFGRGKNGDKIEWSELDEEPLIDAWLEPGSVLYVPLGYPHATSTTTKDSMNKKDTSSTAAEVPADDELSCHVTLGLDTYFYGLCYSALRAFVLAKAKSTETIDMFKLNDDLHSKFFSPIPVGFLCPKELLGDHYGKAFENHVIKELFDLNNRAAEATGVEAPYLGDDEKIRKCIRFIINHWKAVATPSKYAGVVTPPPQGTVESMQAKMLRDSKNRKEESTQKLMYAFARSST